MKKYKTRILFACLTIVIAFAIISALSPINAPNNAKSKYNCDVNAFALTTNINIDSIDGESMYNVNGEFFSAYEDNLVMQDTNGNTVREMDDDYNFISQNDHVILDGNGFLYSCQGNVNVGGNSYRVFNNKKEQVGTMEFDMLNTYGALLDMNGDVVAQYNSKLFGADYIVSIFENCKIDDASVLMMFASYYSDMRADG